MYVITAYFPCPTTNISDSKEWTQYTSWEVSSSTPFCAITFILNLFNRPAKVNLIDQGLFLNVHLMLIRVPCHYGWVIWKWSSRIVMSNMLVTCSIVLLPSFLALTNFGIGYAYLEELSKRPRCLLGL